MPENNSGGWKLAIERVNWPTQQVHAETSETERRLQRLMSVGAAAEYLGVSRATIERLVFRGELAIVKIGRSTRYDIDDDLDQYVENNRAGIKSARPESVTLRDLIEREGEGL
jgi:excisionase family DNA binding protein